jgi:hypothetical protein
MQGCNECATFLFWLLVTMYTNTCTTLDIKELPDDNMH